MYKEIVAAVKGVLEGVPVEGKVHAYERWAVSWNEILKMFKSDDEKIDGWTISRIWAGQIQTTTREIERAHVLRIRAMKGLKDADATELDFQETLENVQNAFNEVDETLGGACETIHPVWGPMAGMVGLQIQSVDIRLFSRVLCHCAECRLCAVETIRRD